MKSNPRSSSEDKRHYWREHVNNWKNSGLSQKQYCQSRSLALSTFCHWKSRVNAPEAKTPKFYPLVIPASSPDPTEAGLVLHVGPKQIQIQIKKDFSQNELKKLVAVLEQL